MGRLKHLIGFLVHLIFRGFLSYHLYLLRAKMLRVPTTRNHLSFLGLMAIAVALISSVWLDPAWYVPSLFGLALFIYVATDLSPGRAWLFGTAVGTISLAIAFHWAPAAIDETTNFGVAGSWFAFVAMVLWESSLFGIFAFALAWFVSHRAESDRRFLAIWLAPFLWIPTEYLWPRVFPWAMAHTHLELLPLIQIAEWTGTSGVSWIVVFAAALVASFPRWHAYSLTQRSGLVFGITLVATVIFFGQMRYDQIQERGKAAVRRGKHLSLAAVQVDPNSADSVERMQSLSRSFDRPVDLICWPESALGYYDESLDHFRDLVRTYKLSERPNSAGDPTDGLDTPLLAGANTYCDGGRDIGPYLNMGFLIAPNKSIIGRYTKRTLMPIGEYFPGEDWLPAVRQWAAIDRVRRRGTSAAPLEHPNGTQLGVLICYEDMSRENCRSTVATGAECLIALINASGFRSPFTLEQHFRLAQLRAVENRRSFVRCAATGVTCFVDPTGRIVSRVDTGGDKVLLATVPLFDHQTVYTRYGEWFSWLCILGVAGAAVAVAAARFGAPPRHSSPG
jgi:apolipoprotein N-acyltransferase